MSKANQEALIRAQLKAVPRYKVGILTTPDFSGDDVRIGGFVTIVPRHNNKHRDYNTAFRSFPDHQHGIMWGYPSDVDVKSGAIKFRQIRVDVSRVFDLSNFIDVMEFYIISHHYDLIVSPRSDLMIDDPEEKAIKKIKSQSMRVKADAFITEADDEKIKELVRVLCGVDPSRTSMNVCRSMLSEMCMTEPQRILSKMEDKDFEYQSLFAQLKEVGLVNESVNRGWLYRQGLPMGNTPEGVVSFMKGDPEFTMTLRRELQQMKKDTAIANGRVEKEPIAKKEEVKKEIPKVVSKPVKTKVKKEPELEKEPAFGESTSDDAENF